MCGCGCLGNVCVRDVCVGMCVCGCVCVGMCVGACVSVGVSGKLMRFNRVKSTDRL